MTVAGIAALFPFFTLHMKAVGISVKEMAWMLLLLPIVSSIGPPLGSQPNRLLHLIQLNLLNTFGRILLECILISFHFTFLFAIQCVNRAVYTWSGQRMQKKNMNLEEKNLDIFLEMFSNMMVLCKYIKYRDSFSCQS